MDSGTSSGEGLEVAAVLLVRVRVRLLRSLVAAILLRGLVRNVFRDVGVGRSVAAAASPPHGAAAAVFALRALPPPTAHNVLCAVRVNASVRCSSSSERVGTRSVREDGRDHAGFGQDGGAAHGCTWGHALAVHDGT